MSEGGFAMVIGPCWGCGRIFTYNPIHVPSIENDGICQRCVDEANAYAREHGQPEIVVHPQAYEPCRTEDLL